MIGRAAVGYLALLVLWIVVMIWFGGCIPPWRGAIG